MIKSEQFVFVKWNSMNVQYYVNKGYAYTKMGEEFSIDIKDIQPSARVKVKVVCDYCGKEFDMYMYAYTRSTKDSNTIACNDCKLIKSMQTIKEKYNVNNCMELQETKEKVFNTIKLRYGVDSPAKLPQHQESMKTYNKELAKEHYVKTCLTKYGVDNTAKLDSVKAKAKQTCIMRYGGESSQCDCSIREKSIESMLNGGSIPTSKPEREMVENIKLAYGENTCVPQYHFSRCVFDCLLTVYNEKIDIEYDGEYWHKNKTESDNKRDLYVISNGIKVLRFKSKGKVPSIKIIELSVNRLVNDKQDKLIVNVEDEDIV